ncbi:MAG: glycosyltransferase, partial [Desulfobacteraceae bacterium]|nr:glycosyltransferase [Desulfobacteraceae bacterium]
MKILYTSNLYPPSIGGTQVHLHTLAKEMNNDGNKVHALIFSSNYRTDWLRLSTIFSERERHYSYEGINVSQIEFSNRTKLEMLPWVIFYYAMIGLSVKKISGYMSPYIDKLAGEPSIVHATRNGREFLSRAALNFAREKKIPFVITPNHHPRWKGFLYKEYDKIYKESDALFALTEAEKKALIDQCGIPAE